MELVTDKDKGVIPGHGHGNKKLDGDVYQTYDRYHRKDRPECTEKGKGFAGIGRAGEGAPDMQRSQRNDNGQKAAEQGKTARRILSNPGIKVQKSVPGIIAGIHLGIRQIFRLFFYIAILPLYSDYYAKF